MSLQRRLLALEERIAPETGPPVSLWLDHTDDGVQIDGVHYVRAADESHEQLVERAIGVVREAHHGAPIFIFAWQR